MRRREFLGVLGGATTWPILAQAQQSALRSIGVLWPASAPPPPPRMESFRLALRQLGFVEGQNFGIQLRYAEKGPQQLPELAAELVRAKVDVIAAFGDLAPRMAREAISRIPIVAISDDIIGAGLVHSLGRPGGNVTGLTIMSPELSAKRLEVLQEMVAGMAYVAALFDPTTGRSQVSITENAARSLNLKLEVFEARNRDEIVAAFRAAREKGVEAVNVLASPILSQLFFAKSLKPLRSIGCRPSISGKSTSTLEVSSPMGHLLRLCGGKAGRSLSRFSTAQTRRTSRSS